MIHEESERFTTSHHEYKNSNDLADNVCRYDLDDLNVAWLEKYNEERVDMGMSEFMSLVFDVHMYRGMLPGRTVLLYLDIYRCCSLLFTKYYMGTPASLNVI